MKLLVLVIVLALSGCKICGDHPVACTAAGVIIATSVALSVDHSHNGHSMEQRATTQPVNCANGACQ